MAQIEWQENDPDIQWKHFKSIEEAKELPLGSILRVHTSIYYKRAMVNNVEIGVYSAGKTKLGSCEWDSFEYKPIKVGKIDTITGRRQCITG
jgi:hypothetical protein